MENNIASWDVRIIRLFHETSLPAARIGLFVVFFWFGALKLLGLSPATPLVLALHDRLIPFITFSTFYALFAGIECLIGILFLIKGAERIVLPLLFLHMITTFFPLFMTPELVWQAPLVPTLEGQYIIKNLLLVAAAMGIAAHLHPMRYTSATANIPE